MQEYLLHLADNALILGHRLSEWCGHGPALEIDMAMTNISLDLIGQARNLYAYAAELEGQGKTEDDLAYLRDVNGFRNVLLVEQPNGDFAQTIARSFFYDSYNYFYQKALCESHDKQLAAIAEKSLKEVAYHLRWSSEWAIRLGDGTEESKQKMQAAIDDLWSFRGELLTPAAYEIEAAKAGYGVNPLEIKEEVEKKLQEILLEATLDLPADGWMHSGGKTGRHSEHLGFILAEMQFLQRAYPDSTW
ncbi:MAG: 1,2-phenylacetyl-CoA epoxidase subunit PaaC [Saprospiraceae bacterium]|nr:phenylacetate-CoA oxygenase subunit PaaC [Saprospiraceae bacterium]MCB9343756.1 phenylacetate-CoA oxygenase subunit PaaC [Lewinellaceae bacterium]